MKSNFLAIMVASIATTSWLAAQGPKREPEEGMYDSCPDLKPPKALLELPAEVSSAPGKLSCHAEFANASGGFVPIYIINRADTPASIPLTGGDPGFKAYRELADGRWERVQPAGSWVMCGDSCSTLTIHPGMFVTFLAKYRPPGTAAANIRYQIPGIDGLATNSGPGSWDEQERDAAQLDGTSGVELPGWIATMRHYRTGAGGDDPRGRPRIEEEIAYLDLLLHYRDYRAPRLWCEQLLEESAQYPGTWRDAAKRAIRNLTERRPATLQTPAGFVEYCIERLDEAAPAGGSPGFGDVSAFPGMIWRAVADVAVREQEKPPGYPWKRVFGALAKRYPKAGPEELEGMCQVMGLERRIHEHVPDDFLFGGLESKHGGFREKCVLLLLHRGLEQPLADAASKLDADGRFAVAKVLVSPDSLSARYGAISDYLVARAKENPGRALEMIHQGSRYNANVYLSPELWLELRPWMERTVSIGLEGPVEVKSHEERGLILRVLRIGFHDRAPFLQKLVKSEAYYEQTSSTVSDGDATVYKTARVRFLAEEARRMLAKLGVAAEP